MILNKCILTDLGSVNRGKSKHRPRNDESLFGGEYPFIQTGEVKSANFYLTKFTNTYNEKGLSQSKLWDKGTLLITIAANIAETAILDIEACFPDSIIGFIPYENKSDVRFVKYYLDYIKKKLQVISQGTTQDNMSVSKLTSMPLFVPEYQNQVKIANILSNYDNLIENNNTRIKLLENMAEELYKEWFARLRFPDFGNTKIVDGIPEGWEEKRIYEFGKVIIGKTPLTTRKEFYNGNIPFIKTPDFKQGLFLTVTEDTLSEMGANTQKNQFISKDSICVSCIGTVGEVIITTENSQTNQQINSIELKDLRYLEYLYFTLKFFKELIQAYASTGATMGNLSKGKFEQFKLKHPDLDLIYNFNEITKPLFEQIKTLQLKNQTLKQTRDLLLPRLISGKLDIENLDII